MEFAETVDRWNTEIFNYFDNRYTNSVTESLNRVSKEISDQGRGYNFKVLRAKILYRTPASKPAKFSYYNAENEFNTCRKTNADQNDFIIPIYNTNTPKYMVEIGSGVDIDELYNFMQKERLFAYSSHILKLK